MTKVSVINTEPMIYHVHPSGGWNYITASLKKCIPDLVNEIIKHDTNNAFKHLIIDTFIDKTFLWDSNASTTVYMDPWIGILHHPVGLQNSCIEVLKSQGFRRSLPSCIGIVVLTEYLASNIRQFISDHPIGVPVFPPIHVIRHAISPWVLEKDTEPQWDERKRVLIHVGQHGRDVEKFFQISCPLFSKYFCTNNYFLPAHTCEDNKEFTWGRRVYTWFKGITRDRLDINISWSRFPIFNAMHPLPDMYNEHVSITNRLNNDATIIFPNGCQHQKCTALPRLDPQTYISVLRESIVYIHLVDASAVNTVLECVITSTPLIVNRHPAIVEVLGEDYMLYANTIEEAESLLASGDMSTFYRASDYLGNIDMSNYKWDVFYSSLQCIIFKEIWKNMIKDAQTEITLMPPCDLVKEGGIEYQKAKERFYKR